MFPQENRNKSQFIKLFSCRPYIITIVKLSFVHLIFEIVPTSSWLARDVKYPLVSSTKQWLENCRAKSNPLESVLRLRSALFMCYDGNLFQVLLPLIKQNWTSVSISSISARMDGVFSHPLATAVNVTWALSKMYLENVLVRFNNVFKIAF